MIEHCSPDSAVRLLREDEVIALHDLADNGGLICDCDSSPELCHCSTIMMLCDEWRAMRASVKPDVAQAAPTRDEIAKAIGKAMYGESTFRSPDLDRWNISDVLPAADAVLALTKQPFFGATCPTYPNCKGGRGLGCQHEIERDAPQAMPAANSPGECLRLKYGYACDELASAVSERDEARYNLAHAVPQAAWQPVEFIVEKIITDVIRPGWGPEERTCYELADQLRAIVPALKEALTRPVRPSLISLIP